MFALLNNVIYLFFQKIISLCEIYDESYSLNSLNSSNPIEKSNKLVDLEFNISDDKNNNHNQNSKQPISFIANKKKSFNNIFCLDAITNIVSNSKPPIPKTSIFTNN